MRANLLARRGRFAVLCFLAVPVIGEAAAAEKPAADQQSPPMDTVALQVDGINTTAGEDNPGVVYILPWQPPTLPRRTRDALNTNAPDLREPMDPGVFERHQNFQQTLNPALDSTSSSR